MRIDRRQMINVGVLAGVTALYVGGVWWPQRSDQTALRARVAAAQAKLGSGAANAMTVTVLDREVQRLQRDLDSNKRTIPAAPELASLFEHITRELARRGATQQEIQQPSPIQVGARYSLVPLSVRFQGSFKCAFDVVRSLESMDRLVRVTRVLVDGESRHPGEPVRVTIELCAFYATREVVTP